MLCQTAQQDPGQEFPCNGKQEDMYVVITSFSVSFLFVEVGNQSVFKSLQNFFMIIHGLEKLNELPDDLWATSYVDFYFNGVRAKSFSTGHSPDCFVLFSLAREFNQGVVDWNLRQMGNHLIINDRW